jgi:hypothetical protein
MPQIPDYPAASVLTSAKILGDQSGVTKYFPASLFNVLTDGDKGDITVSVGGTVLTVDAGAISTAKLADGSITSAKIVGLAVTEGKLADDAVTTTKIANGSVTAGKVASDAITTLKLADNAVITQKITDGAVNAAKLASDAVTTAKIADDAVTAAKIATGAVGTTEIADDAVTAAKIATGAVGTTEIADDAVTAAKIATGAVGTTEIAANAVTFPKLPAATASRLIGRRSGSGGDFEPITLGAGLTMSSGGELSASGGGGGSAPLTRAIAYVDLAASGSGAAVGNGIAFNDLSTAYAAVIAWRAANSNAPVTIWLAPGTYTETGWSVGWVAGTVLVGSGISSTFVNITGQSSTFKLHGWGFTLTANITGGTGTAGAAGTEGSPAGGTGAAGDSLTVELVGDYVMAASSFAASNGGPGGAAYALADPGANGGDGGVGGQCTAFIIKVAQSGNWSFSPGAGGDAGDEAGTGSPGATGTVTPSDLRFNSVIGTLGTLNSHAITTGGSDAAYASRCDLGTLNYGNWIVSGCHTQNSASATSYDDAAGLASAAPPAGM